MTLYLTDSQKDLTIKAILSEINYHQQKINSWVELYRKLQTEQNSHKHGVMQAEGSDVSEGAAVGQRSGGTVAEGLECGNNCHFSSTIGERAIGCESACIMRGGSAKGQP